VPEHGPQHQEFIAWAENYVPDDYFTRGDCAYGLFEDADYTEDWEVQYKTVIKNECVNW